jgi:hypothetical protein
MFTATPCSGQREHVGLGIHGFDPAKSLGRRQFQMLTDQALVHAWAAHRCPQTKAMPGCPERVVKSVHGGVGAWSLELRYGSLADAESTSEISLSEASLKSGIF